MEPQLHSAWHVPLRTQRAELAHITRTLTAAGKQAGPLRSQQGCRRPSRVTRAPTVRAPRPGSPSAGPGHSARQAEQGARAGSQARGMRCVTPSYNLQQRMCTAPLQLPPSSMPLQALRPTRAAASQVSAAPRACLRAAAGNRAPPRLHAAAAAAARHAAAAALKRTRLCTAGLAAP